jgi:23S rRNA pseudouridine2604 synthase
LWMCRVRSRPQAAAPATALLDSDADLPQTKVSINSNTPERSKLRFAIKGAHRGLIAYLCERAQLEILEMRRIRLGRVALRDLPVGQWRYLAREKFEAWAVEHSAQVKEEA